MNPSDYRLLMEAAYVDWKRCHALYLDLACQMAGGANVPPATVAAVRADVERAMADLASMDHQTADAEDIAPCRQVLPSLEALVAASGGQAKGRV